MNGKINHDMEGLNRQKINRKSLDSGYNGQTSLHQTLVKDWYGRVGKGNQESPKGT